jgi:hypothetical protein
MAGGGRAHAHHRGSGHFIVEIRPDVLHEVLIQMHYVNQRFSDASYFGIEII